jgi:hypothetical protein
LPAYANFVDHAMNVNRGFQKNPPGGLVSTVEPLGVCNPPLGAKAAHRSAKNYLSACHPDHDVDFCRALRQVSSIPQGSGLWAGLREPDANNSGRNGGRIPEGSAT